MTGKEKIRKYINQQLAILEYGFDDEAEYGYRCCLKEIRGVIDSLPEESVNDDLYKEAEKAEAIYANVDNSLTGKEEIRRYINQQLENIDFGFDDAAEHGYRCCLKDIKEFIDWLPEESTVDYKSLLKEQLKQEYVEQVNNISKEASNFNVGDDYKNAKIGIDYTNKIKLSDE